MANEDVRGRNWATIVYPESAPVDWMERFGNLHVQGYISPLHDRDVKPVTGELKKPHYHVMMRINGKVSWQRAQSMFESVGGVGCEQVNDWGAYARYLCHLDEKNNGKARYNTGEVQMFGGADYFAETATTKDQSETIKAMQKWCRDNGCILYNRLCDYTADERPDWYRVLITSRGMAVMKQYMQSMEYESRLGE